MNTREGKMMKTFRTLASVVKKRRASSLIYAIFTACKINVTLSRG
jgi:hypothetical protein